MGSGSLIILPSSFLTGLRIIGYAVIFRKNMSDDDDGRNDFIIIHCICSHCSSHSTGSQIDYTVQALQKSLCTHFLISLAMIAVSHCLNSLT